MSKQVLHGFAVLALALISYFLISRFVVSAVSVDGVSMVPTLYNSDRYLLNRWVLLLRAPKPADIVVLQDPLDQALVVKRIIATPGESVWLKDGAVFVNGHKLLESYLPAGTPTFASPRNAEALFLCGRDQFFVLGDNRNYSVDSRVFGPVPRAKILGLIVR